MWRWFRNRSLKKDEAKTPESMMEDLVLTREQEIEQLTFTLNRQTAAVKRLEKRVAETGDEELKARLKHEREHRLRILKQIKTAREEVAKLKEKKRDLL
ncbi:hypothetical protein FLK61_37930 [Paenalkalicoccus suaedae]|uniref:Uncharacterized protein n=1 Tax=Paenalkalicoccus suaedae TaxID=2592382 RepID=A0A859FHX2_9BACI|nr:hypothetical protein [Paenalkalicoccus suaedae]QKS72410.1 hypothetical protein FLK61_37930 [Paenalkalicoccus suaedae]